MKYYSSNSWLPLNDDKIFYVITEAKTVEDAMVLKADFIDLTYAEYLISSQKFTINSIETSILGAADCLLKIDNKYYFDQMSQKAFLKYLSKLKISLQSSKTAVLIGDELTISQFLPPLTKLGYSDFICVVENTESVSEFVQKIQKTFLGLKIQLLNFKQIPLIDSISSFLVVDINHSEQVELVESLTYFNFLTTGSVFFDLRSAQSKELIEEALRAEMFVMDSVVYHSLRQSLAYEVLIKKIN